MDVAEKIRDDVREGMEKSQREFLLRQQLAAIRKELGDVTSEGSDDTADYRSRVEQADIPDKARESALREVGRLERSSDQSPESGWIRTWLDTVLELPWTTTTKDKTDVTAAREVLDADHHGLHDVKDRIVEYLAVRSRRAQRGLQVVGGRGSGAVLALVGPPGVGKTSLGESVARALGRKFVRVALGGVRDEAEIRGHRRTYVGALPGRIVRAITEAGSMHPVMLRDEIDKVGSDYRGDPAAALLEVLDPAQNHTFRDHYLELDLDLSDVVFLATANVIENIPSALLDRMELIQIDGYTEDDKVAIARDFLLPRQAERAALTEAEVTVTEDALRKIAADYTREPGVRQFERLLAKALRKATTKLASDDDQSLTIDEPDLVDYLGRPRFLPESAERSAVPGVATGLAVTGLGGDVLYIEAGATDGEAGLQLTGQLGDVMKESAQIALSYVRAHAEQLGVDPKSLDRRIHVHVPAGAVPKDGPSAGVTMVTALVSMATGRQVRSDVGMTGEVTLNGRVLPIGGVKQKLLAAQRAGLSTVFIPQRNEADLDDVPADVLESLEVKPMVDVADIIAQALAPAEAEASVAA
jgi:ATP-dependent Lon protease